MADTYYLGARVLIRGAYEDMLNNVWVDPPGVACQLRKPDGTVTEYAYDTGNGPVQRASLGNYYYLTPATDQPGEWHYRWDSTGENTGAYEGRFEVKESQF
jgi:hypothetical protein